MIQTCFSFGMTFDGFPSSVTTADKKTPTKTGAKTNCKTKEKTIGVNTKGTRQKHKRLVGEQEKLATWSSKSRKTAPDNPEAVTTLLKYKYLMKLRDFREQV